MNYIIIIDIFNIWYKLRLYVLTGIKKGHAITLDGVTYESVKAAAEALGIARKTVYKRLKGDS